MTTTIAKLKGWVETLKGLSEFFSNLDDPTDGEIAAALDEIVAYLDDVIAEMWAR